MGRRKRSRNGGAKSDSATEEHVQSGATSGQGPPQQPAQPALACIMSTPPPGSGGKKQKKRKAGSSDPGAAPAGSPAGPSGGSSGPGAAPAGPRAGPSGAQAPPPAAQLRTQAPGADSPQPPAALRAAQRPVGLGCRREAPLSPEAPPPATSTPASKPLTHAARCKMVADGAGGLTVELAAGESVVVEGLMAARMLRGVGWVHGFPLVPEASGGRAVAVYSARHMGSCTALEAAPTLAAATGGLLTAAHCDHAPSIVQLSPLEGPEGAGAAGRAGPGRVYAEHARRPAALRAVALPQDWRGACHHVAHSVRDCAAAAAPPPVAVVAGAKGVGKSTLARLLANTLLASTPAVAFLDLDCGQPEVALPGMLSLSLLQHPLLGPPHLRHLLPARTSPASTASPAQAEGVAPAVLVRHFIGDVSPARDPLRFLRASQALAQHYACTPLARLSADPAWADSHVSCREAGIPLVVNTQGWVKGLGLDLLVDTLQQLAPHHFLRIRAASPGKDLPEGAFWDPHWGLPGQGEEAEACVLHVLSNPHTGAGAHLQGPPVPRVPALSPMDSRALMWLAFAERASAHALASGPCSHHIWNCGGRVDGAGMGVAGGFSAEDFALAAERLAGAAPYAVPLEELHVRALFGSVAPWKLLHVLNGALLGLCYPAPGLPPGAVHGEELARCAGVGLVRSVEVTPDRGALLYILTDVDAAELERVTTLEIGRLDLPTQLLHFGHCATLYLAHHCLSTEGTGAGIIKSRGNILRKNSVTAAN